MSNHFWFGNHDPHQYLRPPASGDTYEAPKVQGIVEGRISAKGKLSCLMLQTNKQPNYFQVKKLRKQYKRKSIIKRNKVDSSTTDPRLLYRF